MKEIRAPAAGGKGAAGNGAWRGDYAAGADLMISVATEDGVPAVTAEIIAGASEALRRLAARADTALIHGEDARWILEDVRAICSRHGRLLALALNTLSVPDQGKSER